MVFINHKEFHNLSKNAITEMKIKAKKYGRNIRQFSERQLVHEIAFQFKGDYWVGFEVPYLDSGKITKSTRSDLAILNKNQNEWIFVEVKSTGFPTDDRRENRFGSLKYEEDFKKLKELDGRVYKGSIKGYWIWQYFFETYHGKIDEIIQTFEIKDINNFNGPFKSHNIIEIFGRVEGENLTLGKVLNEIKISSLDTLISIIPEIDNNDKKFSLLMVTSEVK